MIIVSGGQTGADQGSLLGARDAGALTGGWAPKGWRTERGAMPELALYGLRECPQGGYPARTGANVRDSDGTLIFGMPSSPGCLLTQAFARRCKKPVMIIGWQAGLFASPDAVIQTRTWIVQNRVNVLNVAGNRESRNPGIQAACAAFVKEVLCLR